jgi:hypothetical protein
VLKNIGKSLLTCAFACVEYAVAVSFAASLAFLAGQLLNAVSPKIYDYSTERDFIEALGQACDAGEMTYLETREYLRIYREDQPRFRLEIWRIRLTFAVSFAVCVVVVALLFRRYRRLRFRERFKNYFFTARL